MQPTRMPIVDPASSCSLGVGVTEGKGGEGAVHDGARPRGLEVDGGLFRPSTARIAFIPGEVFIKRFSLSLMFWQNRLVCLSMAIFFR